MTGLDWVDLAFALRWASGATGRASLWACMSLAGFALGAFLGAPARARPAAGGLAFPYAPATALAGGLLIGGIVAVSLEGVA